MFKKIWKTLFIIGNVLGFGLVVLLVIVQINVNKSIEKNKSEDEAKFEKIDELRNRGKYDVYYECIYPSDEELVQSIDRIVRERTLINYEIAKIDDSYVVINTEGVEIKCDILLGENFVLAEKTPEYIDEESGISVVKGVAISKGYLGHPSGLEFLPAIFAGILAAITVFIDIIWFIILLIVNAVSKNKQNNGSI